MYRKFAPWITGLSSAAVLAVTVGAPAPAEACGGFFCNRGAPVEQTGEHILFAVDEEEGTTEAHVLINYAGPSREFAWIVPTPSRPEIGLSSAAVFSRLSSMLSPRFILNWSEIGTCLYDDMLAEADTDGGPTAGSGGDERGVTVVDESSVGPYDTVTLQATDAEILIVWLQENDYDLPDDIIPFVEPYVLMGGEIHFVAFKLQSDRDAGDIQPVTLRYDGIKPTIPIQLTGVATVPDMGVTAYVVGPHRAVPENYLHVEINYARLNWLSGGANYEELVTAAMDEAGGKGFRTEFSGSTEAFMGMFVPVDGYDYDAIAGASAFDIVDRLREQGFMGDPQILEMFRRHIPVPEGIDEQSFYNCIECYSEAFDPSSFDAVAFADDLWATIVAPLERAQEIFDSSAQVSRLYTTLSAEDMTLDPIFAFNPDMDDFSNVHEADAIIDCGDGGDYFSSPIIIRLADGREIVTGREVGRGELDAMPAAESWEETGASGAPTPVEDRREVISVALAEHNETVGQAFLLPTSSRAGSGCSATGGGPGALGFGALALVGLALRRRR